MEWDERYDLHRRTHIGTFSTERLLVDDPAAQKAVDEDQLVTWLLSMGPWDVIAHLTWRDRVGRNRDGSVKLMGISEHSAARCVERFMSHLPGVSYFYSVEKNPSRDGHHAHMLWGDCETVYRKEQWAKWLKLHGRARIEPVKSDRDVAGYASKYVMKLPCWWNVNLRWHRRHRFNGTCPAGELLARLQVDTGRVPFSQSRGLNHSDQAVGQQAVGTDFNTETDLSSGAVARERDACSSSVFPLSVRWHQVGPGMWEPEYCSTWNTCSDASIPKDPLVIAQPDSASGVFAQAAVQS